jgi:hypothetical protein
VRVRVLGVSAGVIAVVLLGGSAQPGTAASCTPTRATHPNESKNPNYKPGAPVRSSVGKGHVLVGVVRSSTDCMPLVRVRIEFFQAGPKGYSNGKTSWAGRATVFTRGDGSYRFEGPFPSTYAQRPHIHLRASVGGYVTLNTSYYPRRGETRGRFDLVLPPAPARVSAGVRSPRGSWRVVPVESFVGYRVRERLTFLPAPSDAVGRTSAIDGSARIVGNRIVATKVSTDVRTLKSDEARRDGAVRSLLQRQPVASFTLGSPLVLPTTAPGREFALKARGDLRLHGVTRAVVFPLRARWTSDRLEVIGSLRIAFADYEIRSPRFGPVLSVSDHAKIEVDLSFAHA